MSRALAKASPLLPEIRLAQAISEFEAALSDKHKSAFRTYRSQSVSKTPSHQDVMQLTAEFDRCTSQKSSRACFGPRFTNFLEGVQLFAALGDVVVGGTQNVLSCGVWSLVRMLLMSIISFSTHLDKLSALFMDIGRSAPRYQKIVLLYPRSQTLQSNLTEYYITVVDLCRYLYTFGQKTIIQQFVSSQNVNFLKDFQTDLRNWAELIKEEANLNHAQESSGVRAVVQGMFQATSKHQIRTTNMRVLNFCSTYDHETAWKQLRKVGSATFFEQQLGYQEWRDNSHASTLLFGGILGSGKSVLLANIVNDLSLSIKEEGPLVCYFFCRHDIQESLQARTIIGSLARQLLRTVSNLSATARRCESTYATGDTEKVLDLLLHGFTSGAKIYFVLDGLDECDASEKEICLHALQRAQEKINISVCTSFREEPDKGMDSITKQLLNPCVVFIPRDNPDIATFIEADIVHCLNQGRLTIGDPGLRLEIQSALLEGSEGMFLWVALQIQSLCSLNTDYAIREALSDLPKSLSETYTRILRRSGSSDPALQAKLLQIVLAARRPLRTDELQEALSVIPGDANYDPSKILNNIYKALGCCGCLLITDEEDSTVHIVHPSVKQYLLDGLNRADNYLQLSEKRAQRMMADIVVTYLSYGVFGTELSTVKRKPLAARSAPSAIIQSNFGSAGARVMAFITPGRESEMDVMKVLQARSGSGVKPQPVFSFYAYAERYCRIHIPYIRGHDARIVELAAKLIHDRISEKDKTKWMRSQLILASENGHKDTVVTLLKIDQSNAEVTDANGCTPLMKAAKNGDKDTVGVLLSSGNAKVNAKDRDGRTSLMFAAFGGHSEIVKDLLSDGRAEVDARCKLESTALIEAASRGHTDVVRVLLDIGEAQINAESGGGQTPLIEAASNGHVETVKLLLSKANVEFRGYAGRTALSAAIAMGQKDAAELLLSVADVETQDDRGLTPLMYAVTRGELDIVRMLLQHGKASIETMDEEGRTALMHAEERAHEDIVEALRSHTTSDSPPDE